MKLIINADDLGFTKGINYGILDAFEAGIVSSATLMMNMSTTEHAIELFKGKKIGIGVHLNATSGRPLIKNEALTDEDGFFNKDHNFTKDHIHHLMNEFEAQVKKAIELKIKITHLDSHHHLHMWDRNMFIETCLLAKKYDLKIRSDKGYKYIDEDSLQGVVTTSAFSQEFYDKTVHVNYLIQIIDRHLNQDSLEIMVHPGFICSQLIQKDTYQEKRVVEHSILTSDYMKRYIQSKDISLVNYSEI